MIRLATLIILIANMVCASEVEQKRYSMAELELMAKQNQWNNIILFIKDIPKSEQDLQWNSLLERAAIGYSKTLKEGNFSEVYRVMDDLLLEFPSLRQSQKFLLVKKDLVVSGFKKCFSDPADVSFCVKSAVKEMRAEFSSPELRQSLGTLIVEKSPESGKEVCEVLSSFKEKKGLFEKHCSKIMGIKRN